MREINKVVVHCTATRPEFMSNSPLSEKVAEVRRWHVKDRGWRDIGYHYLIDRDGRVTTGRHISQTGAHARGHNTGSVGVALFGGHGSAETDDFLDNFTPAQDKALRDTLSQLGDAHPIKRIIGHNEVAAKACPGFNVKEWLKQEPPAPAHPDPAEQPSGWGALINAILSIFVRKT